IWERPGQNILIRLYGGIPVHRGDYDRNLIETMLAVLKSGLEVRVRTIRPHLQNLNLFLDFP
ncbi:MAG: hypothetical protein P8Z00_22130, partial [Anaerolineales bacterium]